MIDPTNHDSASDLSRYTFYWQIDCRQAVEAFQFEQTIIKKVQTKLNKNQFPKIAR